jgi:hypothetical protein
MEETWRRVCQGLSEPDVGDLERRQDEVKVEADFEISHSGSEPFRGAFSFPVKEVLSVIRIYVPFRKYVSECRKTNGVIPLLHDHLRYFLHYFK